MVSGFYKPSEGKIIFDGCDITGSKPDKVASKGIVRVFQNNRLFKDMKVLENVLVGHHLRRKTSLVAAVLGTPRYLQEIKQTNEESISLLEQIGLIDYKDESAKALPHGLQRKLEVARALATHPKLLLLDEPATGLSVEETNSTMDFILRVKEDFNLTILLIEHTMRVIMGICPRILVLDYGETIAEGTPEDIKGNARVIEAYLGVE